MIKVHVVIKIKASSDSPQKLRGHVSMIKQDSCVGCAHHSRHQIRQFLLWLPAQVVHICLIMFILVDPTNHLFCIPLWVMFSNARELVIANQVNGLSSIYGNAPNASNITEHFSVVHLHQSLKNNQPNGTMFQTLSLVFILNRRCWVDH